MQAYYINPHGAFGMTRAERRLQSSPERRDECVNKLRDATGAIEERANPGLVV